MHLSEHSMDYPSIFFKMNFKVATGRLLHHFFVLNYKSFDFFSTLIIQKIVQNLISFVMT